MRLVIEQSAGPDTRFAVGSFDSQIGKTIPVEVELGRRVEGVIRSVKVIEDGVKARIEVEIPDGTWPAAQPLVPPSFSIATKPPVPERERLVHDDPALAEQIREGIAQAERGETVDLGSFAQHLDEGDDDD